MFGLTLWNQSNLTFIFSVYICFNLLFKLGTIVSYTHDKLIYLLLFFSNLRINN